MQSPAALNAAAPTGHDGSPLAADDDFPVTPDPSIGPLRSAQTNRTQKGWKKRSASELRQIYAGGVLLAIVAGVASAGIVQFALEQLMRQGVWQPMQYREALLAVGGIGGACGLTIAYAVFVWLWRFRDASWVGRDGVFRYRTGLFGPKVELLRFDDAQELKVQRTRHYHNGAYTGTSYSYVWTGADTRSIFTLTGRFFEGQVDAHDGMHFGLAAERAWTVRKSAELERELATTGKVRFSAGGDWITLSQGVLELGWKGRVERLDRGEIASASLAQGVLVLKRQGAREGFFSSEGVFRFPCANLSNFQLFAFFFERLIGLRLG